MKPFYTESDFLAQLIKQDRQAFNYLYDNYSPALYGIILKMIKNEDTAQDLLQDVFIKIWKNCGKHDPSRGRFFTWMLHVTRNTCLDYLRLLHPEMLDVSLVGDMIENNQTAFTEIHSSDLKELISHLRKEQKILIEMVYWEGYTHEETAFRLQLPLGTVKSRIRDALKKIRFVLTNGLPKPVPVMN
jgi:RNA polymerase sigma-70 factor (ECF subfamily)